MGQSFSSFVVRGSWVESVLGGDAEVLPQGGSGIGGRVQVAFLQEGHDLVDEGVDAVFVDVG
jgi:hypothetical protein